MNNRGKLIIGNWKLNGSKQLMQDVLTELGQALNNQKTPDNFKLAICPPSIYVSEMIQLAQHSGTHLWVGCQNISIHTQGSYTGELSATMVKEAGCELCLVGHSERRTLFNEDDQSCQTKVRLLIAEGVIPVLCIGETLQEKFSGKTREVLSRQLQQALEGTTLTEGKQLYIAYEPVYAIGSGHAVMPEQAQAVHSEIRLLLAELMGADIASQVSILYGGSVTRDNALNLIACPDVDGLLIGGASLNAQHFRTICNQVFSLAPVFNYPHKMKSYENYMDAS